MVSASVTVSAKSIDNLSFGIGPIGFGHTLANGCHCVILFRFAKRSQNSDFFLSMNQDSNLSQVTQLFF